MELDEIKIFGRWSTKDVVVKDPGLRNYINLTPIYVPHTAGRYTKRQFEKAKMNIVERLVNKVMRREENTGKKLKALKIVEEAFEIIEKRTKQNPIQILVDAIENAGPREDTTRISYGGIVYLQSVDCSSLRRIDVALRNIAIGAYMAAHKSKKPIEEALAEEIIAAARGDMQKSYAVRKKEETERVAQSAR